MAEIVSSPLIKNRLKEMTMVKMITDYNKYMSEYVKRRYRILKLRAVNYKGGKCIKCGYDKNLACLTFHHRDPKEKELDWRALRKRSWDFIITELDKCNLMCCRCHTELHNDNDSIGEAVKWMETKKRTPIRGTVRICKQCGIEFVMKKGDRSHKTFCSPLCSQFANTKGDWPLNEKLIEMNKTMSYAQIGKMVGVSYHSVRKRIDRLKTRGPIPQKAVDLSFKEE